MNIESFLSNADIENFNHALEHARVTGGGGFYVWSPEKKIVLIGFCKEGELVTWFVTPASNQVEIEAAKHVVVSGIVQTAGLLNDAMYESERLASSAISKASMKH